MVASVSVAWVRSPPGLKTSEELSRGNAGLPGRAHYHAPIAEVVITVLCLQLEAEQILDELERSPTFGSAGTENIDGRRGRRMHVSDAETVETACTTLVEELRDLTWLWREYVRFDPGE